MTIVIKDLEEKIPEEKESLAVTAETEK